MSKGTKKSIYIPERYEKFYNDLVNDEKSDSDVIMQAIYDKTVQKYAKVNISEGAYIALANGRFDLLQHTKFENGFSIITLKEDAYRNKDGSRGEFADAKDDLMKYLENK